MVEIITVALQGKYGPKVGDVFYGMGKLSKLKPEQFRVGETYKVDVWTADSGKKYINKIMETVAPVVATPATGVATPATTVAPTLPPAVESAVSKTVEAPVMYGRKASPYELEKDIRIHVSGIIQAVISSPALSVIPPEEFNAMVETKTREMLAVAQKIVTERLGK